MAHMLPDLGYDFDALEPHIDARTMEIHHDRHHATYVANLNAALAGQDDLAGMDIGQLVGNLGSVPEGIGTAVRNNGGGHFNHSLFWQVIAPGGAGYQANASEGLKSAIDAAFGDLAGFESALATAAAGRFGSGWAWLVKTDDGVAVTNTANQDNPLMDGSGTPLLGIDVWEHAYYLNYQNRRPAYIAAFNQVINWAEVSRRYSM